MNNELSLKIVTIKYVINWLKFVRLNIVTQKLLLQVDDPKNNVYRIHYC
jgi:hypothetical protein